MACNRSSSQLRGEGGGLAVDQPSAPVGAGSCESAAIVADLISTAVDDKLSRLFSTRILPEGLRRALGQLRARKAYLTVMQPGASRAWLIDQLHIHAVEIHVVSPACVTVHGALQCGRARVAGKGPEAVHGA